MYRRRRRSLKGEPFFQTCGAVGVKAVEECEWLVEEIGTDLNFISSYILVSCDEEQHKMSDPSSDTSIILFHCISFHLFHLLCLVAPPSLSPPPTTPP